MKQKMMRHRILFKKTLLSRKTKLFVFLIVVSSAFGLIDQVLAQSQELTVDEMYTLAREAAFTYGDYSKARNLAYKALEESPDYHGIRIFIARLFGWEGNYGSARQELETVLNRDPDNKEAFEALTNIESRSGDLSQALRVNSRALDQFPGDEDLLMQRASVLYSFEEYARSEQVYKSIMARTPGNIEAREGLTSARLMQLKHTASISYRHDTFGELFEPWRFMEVQLSRQTRYGSVIGRVQYANRFSTNGAQFNLDAYPSIMSGLYAYVSSGFSDSDIHPRFRFGFSLYKSLPRAYEAEAGMRYLNFTVSETYIYTASLTKYIGSYMVTGRSYLIPATSGNSFSGNVLIRRYLGSADKYVSVSGGYGTASNDIQFAQEVNTLNSWSISLDTQYPIGKRFIISGTAGIDSEEFRSYTRDRFSIKIGLSYRF